ncbi:MAG: serine hydrolase [Actinomycetota bacterium]|nr:serine hydrolase [Actinomycetota bacterium]
MRGVPTSELRSLVAVECRRFAVPGAAVAVVAGGEVVLAEGFGRRNETEPVTSKTLYMLASDTKCFAAATLCLLVEDGDLDLDRPVQDYLPWFAMHDERISGWVTCRDLLAHRTGLPRHDLMTVGDGGFVITNEEIARKMRYLEGSRPFRQGFGYNNAHYATAGHVTEVLTARPWAGFLAERVLVPLGMSATSTYRPELSQFDFAAPHVGGRRLPFQTRGYDLPSGGLVTNAEDLSRWLLARLGHGPISSAVLRMLHAPSVISGEELPFEELQPMGYALGNLVFAYRGHRLHLHGGSQIGFASQVVVVPDAQVGVAVMTNAHGSRLPLALALSLLDPLLGLEPLPWGVRLGDEATPVPAPPPPRQPPPRAVQDYAGRFRHPAYGEFALRVGDGGLVPSFHGLDDQLTLTHLGDDQWRLDFASVPGFQVPVTFGCAPGGEIVAAVLRLEPALAPLEFPRDDVGCPA